MDVQAFKPGTIDKYWFHGTSSVRKTISRGLHQMSLLIVPSYGKINLGLLILNKRSDGYHDIATVFQQIDLHDTITFQRESSNFQLTVSHESLSSSEDNLIHQACVAMRDKCRMNQAFQIHLDKIIPMGGGLGGGSSNAAVTLMALNYLWGNKLSTDELLKTAGEIGSDVPFFITGGTALGQGRGEVLTPLELPGDWWIVLVCPDESISTEWAYQRARITLTKEEKITNFSSIFEGFTPRLLQNSLRNELEDAVFEKYPLLQEIKILLYQRNAFYASMSGSGSTVYGLFRKRAEAEKAVAFFSIRRRLSTFLCRPISSHPFEEMG
jgi:4-diphosphocytidyl-2-C-methyl-D-erythritol kinase